MLHYGKVADPNRDSLFFNPGFTAFFPKATNYPDSVDPDPNSDQLHQYPSFTALCPTFDFVALQYIITESEYPDSVALYSNCSRLSRLCSSMFQL